MDDGAKKMADVIGGLFQECCSVLNTLLNVSRLTLSMCKVAIINIAGIALR
jgi:hypothetical protein